MVVLIILLALPFCSIAQRVGFELIYEPASFTLLNGVNVLKEPLYEYTVKSISHPQYGFGLYVKSKNRWKYGIQVSHLNYSVYASFKYYLPDFGNVWVENELTNLYETRRTGVNLFFGKQINKFSFTQYIGAYNSYDFKERVPHTPGFEWGYQLISHLVSEDGELVNEVASIGAYRYSISRPNKAMGNQTFATNLGYNVSDNLEIGVNFRFHASSSAIIHFQNYEQRDILDLGGIVLDDSNLIGEVIVREDYITYGLFISYGLSTSKSASSKNKTAL